MDSKLIYIKVQQRLNKLSSNDFDNIECWAVTEAFNKAQLAWVRGEIDKAEATRKKVDDLQILLKPHTLKGNNVSDYFRTESLPSDYLGFNKLRPFATTVDCPKGKYIRTDLVEEANTEELLRDWSYSPSFPWSETFHSIVGNKIKIYTNKEFNITYAELTYYRFPKNIVIAGCEDIDGNKPQSSINPEFKDDIVELLIDKTVSILAGDIESWNQYQRNEQNFEKNK
jgi:hypothetical protein